ncbi:hypothetical protein CPB85DRAFT_1441908 [Mucidula mucida]|nr:hypothetical protein CPB85DRAFT_1441908 [Mucidula mucida]
MKTEIQRFDDSLLENITKHLTAGEDFSHEKWDDTREIYAVIGYRGSQTFEDSRLAIDEVDRIQREHPNEAGIIQQGRLLGWLSVTRALGDFQPKASYSIGSRALKWIYRAPLPSDFWSEWKAEGHINMPYISSTAHVECHELAECDMLIFASDGLRDALPPPLTPDECWDILVSLVHGAPDARIGHGCISDGGNNAAENLFKNTLFGTDAVKMEAALKATADMRDDMSVVIVNFKYGDRNADVPRNCL